MHGCTRLSGTVRAVLCSRPLHETTSDISSHAPGANRSGLRWADPYPRAYAHFNGYTRSICDSHEYPNTHPGAMRR